MLADQSELPQIEETEKVQEADALATGDEMDNAGVVENGQEQNQDTQIEPREDNETEEREVEGAVDAVIEAEGADAVASETVVPDSIETTLIQHEKEYLEQEASRKEKIKEVLTDRTKVPASYYSNSKKELLILQYM
jgi:hypothetical protein